MASLEVTRRIVVRQDEIGQLGGEWDLVTRQDEICRSTWRLMRLGNYL